MEYQLPIFGSVETTIGVWFKSDINLDHGLIGYGVSGGGGEGGGEALLPFGGPHFSKTKR